MRNAFSVLFCLISTLVSAQFYDTVHSVINNIKTDKHVNIPGTRLYLIPPPGFIVSKSFLGLQKGNNGIVVYDIVGGSYYTNAATFDRNGFEQKGARVFDYRQIKVNGYPAKYLLTQGDMTSTAHALAFGDSTFCTLVMATYINTDEATGRDILRALNSIYYDKNKKIDPFETAYFTLDDRDSKYKFFQYTANLYTYTIGGVDKGKNNTFPVVIVTQLPKPENSSAKSIAELMIQKSVQYGMGNLKVKNSSTNKVNGYDAYEAEVYGDMQGQNRLIYQLVIVKDDEAIVIEGVADNDFLDNLNDFKKLAHTVKFK